MKLCAIPDYSVDNKTVNDPSLECIYIFSTEHPQKSPFFDWLTVVLMNLFFVINISSAVVFFVLKRQGKIVSQFKDVYLILTTLSSIFHVISVFMTYGFFWPTLNDHIVEHTCSLWNFWFQWFFGFGVWISILCVRIFSIAQTTIPKLIHPDPRIVMFQRIMLFIVSIGIIIVIGILAEVTRSFYIETNGHCVTRFWVKLLILLWLITMIVFLLVISYIIKKQSLIDDDSHLVNMELKIIKVTWPILLTCIILNFSGLTIYGIVRFTFIMLIIFMYMWSSMVIYLNHICLYFGGKYQCISVILEFLNINPNKKYTLITEDSDSYLSQPITARDRFSSEEDYPNLHVTDEMSETSADFLLKSNPFISTSSTTLVTPKEDLNKIDLDNVDDQKNIIQMIKTNSDCLREYCDKLIKLCDMQFTNTNTRKTADFDEWNADKEQYETHTVVLKFLVTMFIEFQESHQSFVLRQINYQKYIKDVISILCKYVTTNLNSEYIHADGDTLKRPGDLTLSALYNLKMLPIIVFKLKSYRSTSLQTDEYPEDLIQSIEQFYKFLLDKIVDEFFSFWHNSDGFQEMKNNHNQRELAMTSYNMDSNTLF